MKSIIINIFLNIILITLGVVLAYNVINTTPVVGFILFTLLTFVLPIIGFTCNSIFQKRFDILISNLYIVLGTAILSIIPIEIFKHTDKVFQAKEKINDNNYSGGNSTLSLDINLSFNIVDHIMSLFMWGLLASVIGVTISAIRNKLKKRNKQK